MYYVTFYLLLVCLICISMFLFILRNIYCEMSKCMLTLDLELTTMFIMRTISLLMSMFVLLLLLLFCLVLCRLDN